MSVHVQAPDAMRSLGSALQLLTTSLGSYLASAVTIIVASATTKYAFAFSCHCIRALLFIAGDMTKLYPHVHVMSTFAMLYYLVMTRAYCLSAVSRPSAVSL